MHNKGGAFLEVCSERYYNDPILFAKEVINMTPTNQQASALDALANGKKKVAVKSGHGVGKSCLTSIAILWFLCTRPMARVIVTAPSSNQLYNTMMSEVKLWYNRSVLSELDLFRFTKDRVRINHEDYCNNWFLSAVSVANPENISGTHAEHVLAVVDEGAGVDTDIFVRLEGVLTTAGSYLITCGNPSFTSGYFYDIFHNPDYAKQYDLFTFNCEQSDNVDVDWIEYMKDKYGEDSNIYKVRVLGEFAPMNEDVIIRREDVNRSIGREIMQRSTSTTFIGVDVSSGEGNDFTCISVRQGLKEIHREKIKMKLRDVKNHLIIMASRYACTSSTIVMNVDTTGLGIQLGQDLGDHFYYKENVEVNEINFSFKAKRNKEYGNSFTEMFFWLKDQIDKISLLKQPDSTLEEDLGSRRFGYDHSGRYIAEKKKEFIKRFGRSPDEGDAVLLAFYDITGYGALEERYIDKEEW